MTTGDINDPGAGLEALCNYLRFHMIRPAPAFATWNYSIMLLENTALPPPPMRSLRLLRKIFSQPGQRTNRGEINQ